MWRRAFSEIKPGAVRHYSLKCSIAVKTPCFARTSTPTMGVACQFSSIQKKAIRALAQAGKKGGNTNIETPESQERPSTNDATEVPVTDKESTATPEPDSAPELKPKIGTQEAQSSQVDTSLGAASKPAPMLHEFAPKILVAGVGGAGGNAVNNMIAQGTLRQVDFLAFNTDAQHLSTVLTDQRLQIGASLTHGLGCGANPDAGREAAEECREEIEQMLRGAHMVFITAGMGGGTGTGAAPVVADICYNLGILTVGVVTLPFSFEGTLRKRLAMEGISRLQPVVDTLIVIPNQNLFSVIGADTSFVDAFQVADQVLLAGVKSITDLMVSPGLINLDFADVQSVMHGMGNALLGTGEADGDDRALEAAKQALSNPLLGTELNIETAKGMLVNISGGRDMTLMEVDKAAQMITQQVKDEYANIIFGSAFDESLEGRIRVSVVATGVENIAGESSQE